MGMRAVRADGRLARRTTFGRCAVLPICLVVAVGACGGTISPEPTPTAQVPIGTAASASPSASATATAGSTVVAPASFAVESASPVSPVSPTQDAAMPEPPAASIQVEGGDPVVGQLGGFTWQQGGSASPWLPGTPIHVGNGERLQLTLAEPVGIATWTASYVPAAQLDGPAAGLGQGAAGPVAFTGPRPGQWSVKVSVWFAGGLGSAAYFWGVVVE